MKKIYFLCAVLLCALVNFVSANSAFDVVNVLKNNSEIKFQIKINSNDVTAKQLAKAEDNGTIFLILDGFKKPLSATYKEVITASDNHALVEALIIQVTEQQPNQIFIRIKPKSNVSYLVYQKSNQLFFDLRPEEGKGSISLYQKNKMSKVIHYINDMSTHSIILKSAPDNTIVNFYAKDFSAKESLVLLAKWNQWDLYNYKNFVLLSDQPIKPSNSFKPITQATEKIKFAFEDVESGGIAMIISDFVKIPVTAYTKNNVTIYTQSEPWGDILEAIAIIDGVSLHMAGGEVYFGK